MNRILDGAVGVILGIVLGAGVTTIVDDAHTASAPTAPTTCTGALCPGTYTGGSHGATDRVHLDGTGGVGAVIRNPQTVCTGMLCPGSYTGGSGNGAVIEQHSAHHCSGLCVGLTVRGGDGPALPARLDGVGGNGGSVR